MSSPLLHRACNRMPTKRNGAHLLAPQHRHVDAY
jgi:hypothetical protein